MDKGLFQEGKRAYADGDFREAAKAFLAAVGDDPQGAGEALHWAGNALMRLKRFDDAATAYEHALEDEQYLRKGTVAANLGAAYRAAGRLEEAVTAYERALRADDYAKPWKAYLGKAGALYELGRLEEAAASYRFAAVEPSNPDPGKALNNLGLCYMALGRAEDAVEAYSAACAIPDYAGVGRACANLGLALSVLGRHEEALDAFRRATEEHGFELSGGLEEAFRISTDAVASKVAEAEKEAAPEEPRDVFAGMEEPDSDFFTRTEEEMRALDRKARREERRSRPFMERFGALIAGVVVGLILLGVAGFAWSKGYGYPSQTATVEGLLRAHEEGRSGDYAKYWVAVPDVDVEQEMLSLPQNYVDYEIGATESTADKAEVSVTIRLEGGAPIQYKFTLAREGVGWKITDIENDWRSTGGGA
ncbi:MAG: hypothetical protein Kow0056_04290 [Coriobacteriia bacterium]